jgi:hypothetical protein
MDERTYRWIAIAAGLALTLLLVTLLVYGVIELVRGHYRGGIGAVVVSLSIPILIGGISFLATRADERLARWRARRVANPS